MVRLKGAGVVNKSRLDQVDQVSKEVDFTCTLVQANRLRHAVTTNIGGKPGKSVQVTCGMDFAPRTLPSTTSANPVGAHRQGPFKINKDSAFASSSTSISLWVPGLASLPGSSLDLCLDVLPHKQKKQKTHT